MVYKNLKESTDACDINWSSIKKSIEDVYQSSLKLGHSLNTQLEKIKFGMISYLRDECKLDVKPIYAINGFDINNRLVYVETVREDLGYSVHVRMRDFGPEVKGPHEYTFLHHSAYPAHISSEELLSNHLYQWVIQELLACAEKATGKELTTFKVPKDPKTMPKLTLEDVFPVETDDHACYLRYHVSTPFNQFYSYEFCTLDQPLEGDSFIQDFADGKHPLPKLTEDDVMDKVRVDLCSPILAAILQKLVSFPDEKMFITKEWAKYYGLYDFSLSSEIRKLKEEIDTYMVSDYFEFMSDETENFIFTVKRSVITQFSFDYKETL